jgi:hypothetical protein
MSKPGCGVARFGIIEGGEETVLVNSSVIGESVVPTFNCGIIFVFAAGDNIVAGGIVAGANTFVVAELFPCGTVPSVALRTAAAPLLTPII